MLKTLLTLIATLLLATTAAFAAVDVNTATEAELDGIKGIGPGLSGRIIEERKSAPFKDWADFIGRVGGVGNKTAVNFSKEGLTVNGKKYSAAAAAKAEAKNKQKNASAQATDRKARSSTEKETATPAAAPTAPGPAASASKN
ncbi:MAG: helix-hairpin-helix domain-containing protein [Acidovorax sp.]|uniref:ComEA family DNA-binding protein n=1 Tax=Acidovorax sp. TaxID=1872122 RepID=UPI00262B7B04|nr:helix-hairpin-helix domain-containing protein [Acidovorax sp.]MDH4416775.1 helix-hairpin-helix domain-containing protein [Acidovorax sp.]